MSYKDYEIILTSHGLQRIRQRAANSTDALALARSALNHGKPPTSSFDGRKAVRPEGFDKFVYREFLHDTFVFGILEFEKRAHLLTVYIPYGEYREQLNKSSSLQSSREPVRFIL